MNNDSFESFFKRATEHEPFPYQIRLATSEALPQLIDIPTGAGKTAAVVLAWLWRRRFAAEEVRKATPRRLVYCLPMRVLVEQTRDNIVNWLDNLGMLAGQAFRKDTQKDGKIEDYRPREKQKSAQDDTRPVDQYAKEQGFEGNRIAVTVLMGGEDTDEWDIYPERDAVIIGTQDMLLSRALNRGYGMSRYRWPVHFGLLNNDCLWVMDEVQLMGSGLATTAQMDAFRAKFMTWHICQSIWMSATLRPRWLETVDFRNEVSKLTRMALGDKDLGNPEIRKRLDAKKPVVTATTTISEDPERFAQLVRDWQQQNPGVLALVVVNTVKRAKDLFEALKRIYGSTLLHRKNRIKARGEAETAISIPTPELMLIHSRFRQPDRQSVVDKILKEKIPEAGRIVVATQVIEAGVDISAKALFTELAPWANLVQRFGRCNRYGEYEDSTVLWINVPTGGKKSLAAPYEDGELDSARLLLNSSNCLDVGPAKLEVLLKGIPDAEKERLFPHVQTHILRQHDMHGLFSTEPDLAGGFTDISPLIRDTNMDCDVQVYWREFKGVPAPNAPFREELCSVPIYELQNLLGEKGYTWEWDGELDRWQKRRSKEIRPGMTLLLNVSQGGYNCLTGWTGRLKDKTMPYFDPGIGQDFLYGDGQSLSQWLPLSQHLLDTEAEASAIIKELEMAGLAEGKAVVAAAWWHDVGKSHHLWQDAVENYVQGLRMKADKLISSVPEDSHLIDFIKGVLSTLTHQTGKWAKFPNLLSEIRKSKLAPAQRNIIWRVLNTSFRPAMRHEAASSLVAWRRWQEKVNGWSGLTVYLIAAHHGKVRTVLRSSEKGNDAFGVRSGDKLPALPPWLPEIGEKEILDLAPKSFGMVGQWDGEDNTFTPITPSWVSLVAELIGPEISTDVAPCDAVPQMEPRGLGPFRLAYLEALVSAADARASQLPGRGRLP